MLTLVRIRFGSHLYGTATPASDVDYKSVFLPTWTDILLQRVPPTISTRRPKGTGEKNYAGEIDEEAYSLQRFLGLAAEGQTVALDVLFAPRTSMEHMPHELWFNIVENRHRLITKKSAAYLGYCRQQANKYGIKGSRVAAARLALAALKDLAGRSGPHAKLGAYAADIESLVKASGEHMAIVPIDQPGGGQVSFWEVCGRKLSYTAAIQSAYLTVARLVDEYGQRALMAEKQEGVDWKALSHAVRVGRQAIELLSTGHVTFPRPEREHLVDIKLGRLQYKDVAEEIEGLLTDVEAASATSTLPEKADKTWIDDLVIGAYRSRVIAI